MGDTALANHPSLNERHMRNIIKSMSKEKRDELKQKLEEADDSPSHPVITPISPPSHVLDIQDNMEEHEGEEGNTIHEALVEIDKMSKIGLQTSYQREKGRFSNTLCHDKKCNKIGMVVVGFVLKKYNELRRWRRVYCCRGCARGLRSGRSFISAMVFVW